MLQRMDVPLEQVQESDLTTGQAPKLVPVQHDGCISHQILNR